MQVFRTTRRLGTALAAFSTMKSSSNSSSNNKPKLRGVIFDMDGTLTVPNLDFATMYQRCNVARDQDILQAIASMPVPEAIKARAIVEEMEEQGRQTLQLMPGAAELGTWLKSHQIPMALVTRNSQTTVQYFVDKMWTNSGSDFSVLLSRDDPLPHKPHPAAIETIAQEWSMELPSSELLMVGDSPSNDVVFGRAAGISTALVDTSRKHGEIEVADQKADLSVQDLWDLPRLLWEHFEIQSPLGTNVPLQKYPPPPVPVNDGAARAAYHGNLDALRQFDWLEWNAPERGSGNTPLIWAADQGHLDTVEFLLNKNVDVNVRGYLGATAVCRASRRGYASILKVLLQHHDGANPDIPNDKMQYPLHFAAFKQHKDCVWLLLNDGAANTMVLDRKGRTPAEDTSDSTIRDMIVQVRHEANSKLLSR